MASNNLNSVDIGRTLKAVRLSAGLSQKDLSERIGLSRSTVSRIERGTKKLTQKEISQYLKKGKLAIKKYESFISSTLKINEAKKRQDQLELDKNLKSAANQNISRSSVIQILRSYFEGQPVKEVYLFGSTARNEHSPKSDIDIYLSFIDSHPTNIFELGKMQVEITKLTGRDVDLVLAGSEYEFIKDSLSKEKILIYG